MESDGEDIFLTQNKFRDTSPKEFRFKPPLTEEELQARLKDSVPKSTQYKNEWAMKIFKRWQEERLMRAVDENLSIPAKCLNVNLVDMSANCLDKALKFFVFEIKKQDGDDYPANSLYGILSALQSTLKASGSPFNIFEDRAFLQSRTALDTVMKERSADGLGASCRKSADIITISEENKLWEMGLLGTDNPRKLLNKNYFGCLNFALRGGKEHRTLRMFETPQITGPHVDENGRKYMLYKEDASKSNSGGLRHRQVVPKTSRAYDNPSDPDRCYVKIFLKYKELCRGNSATKAFYFNPIANPKSIDKWFSSVPVGHNSLQCIIKQMCADAGLQGNRSNHSLRATTATRLFRAKVDEQLICEQTGHRSSVVRVYKRSSKAQKIEKTVPSATISNVSELATTIPKVNAHPAAETINETSSNSNVKDSGICFIFNINK